MGDRVRIQVDGATIMVESGMTLAAAMMMSGLAAMRRSPGGDPRGVLCAMGSCHECRATVDGVRGVKTCMIEVKEGQKIERDQPLGLASLEAKIDRSIRTVEFDLAVIGAGPAGLAAACAAAELGRSVVIIDESIRPGGRIWSYRHEPPLAARSWLERARQAGVQRLQGYTVYRGQPGELEVAGVTDGNRVRVICHKIIVATGARERFLPFPGWTLPGVVGAGALQSLIKGGLDVRDRTLLVAGSGPLLLAVARLANESGARVTLAEQASFADRSGLAIPLLLSPSRWRPALNLWNALADVEKSSSSWVKEARGDGRVEEVVLRTPAGDRVMAVDGLAVGYGLIPESRVAAGLGCDLDESGAVRVDAHQQSSIPGILCAGELTGVAGNEAAIDEGLIAGIVAAGRNPQSRLLARVRRHRFWGQALESAHPLRDEVLQLATEDVIACRCEDVATGDLSGVTSFREARLIHRLGMGPCQGRVCESSPICQRLTGSDTIRPPWMVVPSGLSTRVSQVRDSE